MRLLSIVALTFVAAISNGCTPQEKQVSTPSPPNAWLKPGATQASYMSDRYECLQAARQQTSSGFVSNGIGASRSGTTFSAALFESCMGAKAYLKDVNGNLKPPANSVVYMD